MNVTSKKEPERVISFHKEKQLCLFYRSSAKKEGRQKDTHYFKFGIKFCFCMMLILLLYERGNCLFVKILFFFFFFLEDGYLEMW